MTMYSAMILMSVALTMLIAIVPRIHVAFLKAEELEEEQEHELLQQLQVERNSWVLRHLGCGLAAFLLVWMEKTFPDMDVPEPLAEIMAIYAASALLSAVLESLLAQKIARILANLPGRMREWDRE